MYLIAILILETIPERTRKPWSSSEIQAVTKHFHKHIVGKSIPGKSEIEKFMKISDISGRSWSNIEDYIRNYKRARSKTSTFA